MGGTTFDHYAEGVNVDDAFKNAHEEATYEHGHGGYSGTIAEKPGYVVITHEPMLLNEAYHLVNKLTDANDPRINDKWGPAGAIPIVSDTRNVTVGPFEYTHDLSKGTEQEALIEAVTPLVKLRRGETIQSAWVNSYQQPDRGPRYGGYSSIGALSRAPRAEVRKQCHATVTINKKPMTRTQELTIKIPGGLDYQAENEAVRKAITEKVRLKKDEALISWNVTSHTPGKRKVKAEATKGATKARYIVTGSQHQSWDNGFDSQADARAHAVELATNPRPFMASQGEEILHEVHAITKRVDGQPLVRVTSKVDDVTCEVKAVIKTGKITEQQTGWLFFGWSSC